MRRITGTTSLVIGLLALLMWTGVAAQQAKSPYIKASGAAYGNVDAITQDELKTYEYFLSADQLEGRNLPSRGYDTAALYIASHMKEWGLVPARTVAPADGPLQAYLVPFELVASQNDTANMKLSVTLPAGGGRGGRGGAGGGAPAAGAAGAGAAAGARAAGAAPAQPAVPRAFEYGKDWTVGGGGGRGGGAAAAEIASAGLVFVGNGYVINKTKTNPYEGIDVRGKVMVVAGMPAELAAAQAAAGAAAGRGGAGGGRGGGAANPLGVENTDFTTPQTYAAKNGAAGIIMIPTFQQLSGMTTPTAPRASLNGPSYQVVKFQAARPASVPTITAGIDLINALFQGEKLSGAQVFNGAAANAKLDSFDLAADKKVSLKVAVASDKKYAYNVMAMVEGRDPVMKNEYIVMSAHLDHNGLANPDANGGDGVYNGADDDASGCVALMGMARAYATGAAKGIRAKRTMIFLWMAGEEKGLWGSQYFNQFPPVDITKVVADLNMDMIGRSKTPGYVDPASYKLTEPNEVFVVGPRVASDELGKIVQTVNNAYLKLKLNDFYDAVEPDATHDNLGPGTSGQRIFSRSDHYNFVKMGIPIAFFTDGLHVDYHRVTDSAEKIDYDKVEAVTKTLYAVSWVLGNSATRPKLNAKLPDRLVNDMKTVKDQGWGKLTPLK
jgi:Zn-dependent M28 family amino/carboxypeptidase